MEVMKKNLTKLVLAGVLTIVILRLTACNGRSEDIPEEDVRAFGVEDLPDWIRNSSTDEDLEYFLSAMSPEALEIFFTSGAGSMQEPPEIPEGSRVISAGDDNLFYSLKEAIPIITREQAEEAINNVEFHGLLTAEQISELKSLLDD